MNTSSENKPSNPHTINLLHRNLAKDVQVRPVENSAKDAIQARVIGVKQSLIGYPVRHEPHAEEEEEEENVLHLNEINSYPAVFTASASVTHCAMSVYRNISHHLANDDDFRSQLFVNGENVNEAKGEDHVVNTQDIPAESIRPPEHPKTHAALMQKQCNNDTSERSTFKIITINIQRQCGLSRYRPKVLITSMLN